MYGFTDDAFAAIREAYVTHYETVVGDKYHEGQETFEYGTTSGRIIITQEQFMGEPDIITVVNETEYVVVYGGKRDETERELVRIRRTFAENHTIATIVFSVTSQIAE